MLAGCLTQHCALLWPVSIHMFVLSRATAYIQTIILQFVTSAKGRRLWFRWECQFCYCFLVSRITQMLILTELVGGVGDGSVQQ